MIIRLLKSISLRSEVSSSGFFFYGYAQSFHPCIFCYIEDLNDSFEYYALIRPDDHRPHFVKSKERFQFNLQIPKTLGLVIEKDFISTINGYGNWLFLINRHFDIGLREFHNDSGLSRRVERIDQTECGEEKDKDVEDDVGKSQGLQPNV